MRIAFILNFYYVMQFKVNLLKFVKIHISEIYLILALYQIKSTMAKFLSSSRADEVPWRSKY